MAQIGLDVLSEVDIDIGSQTGNKLNSHTSTFGETLKGVRKPP